ncbi:MAG TPA: tetratricopeptide repeat protein [Rhizomicrobium sp.]|nr:tetratricopeptide repeat protein [Rhizomicrobium sp.]
MRRSLLWRFRNAVFDEQALTLSVNGAQVELERRPLELLSFLLMHAGEVVTKDEILDAIWPDRDISEASLTKCVARLRSALSDDEHTTIRTAHGFGYRFAAPVTVQDVEARALVLPPKVELSPGDKAPHRPGWTLARKLGAGGFGDAWLGQLSGTDEQRVFKYASQDSGLVALRREVALGRLLREGLGPRDDLNRILDWNFAEPPYFIETTYWPEGNLAEWCEAQGGVGAVPLGTRIELVAEIADALSAAHSMGVLHKDMKPANVLIRTGAAGRPRTVLTDFGSGRALDHSRFAAFGITGFDGRVTGPEVTSGTALYRAPELLEGGTPTVQADLYALGVLLFQIVTGDFRRPLAPGWEHLVVDQMLRADIAMAAAGDPERRLSDAAEFARRLRHLDQRRREADREEAAQAELGKARIALDRARARRIPIIALVAALAVGLSASTWMYWRAQQERSRAESSAAQERAVTSFLTDDLLSSANPMLAGNPDIKVKDVLRTAAANLQKHFPSGGLDRAAIEAVLGQVYAGLAEPKQAEALLKTALQRRRAVLGEAAPQTQAMRIALADLYEREIENPALGKIGHDILAAGSTDVATQLHGRYAVLLFECDSQTGTACTNALRIMLADTRKALGPHDPFALRVQTNLAYHLGDNAKVSEAVPLAREAVALSAQIYGANHPLVQERRFQLAEILIEANSVSEAILILEDVRRVLLKISGRETGLTTRAINQIGHAYASEKRYEDALRAFHVALDYNIATHGESFEGTYEGYNNIASVLGNMGRTKDAIAAGKKAWDLERRAAGADNPDTLWFENNLANYYRQDGNNAEAARVWSDVVQRGRKQFTHGEWDLAHFLFHLGEMQALLGDTNAARASLTESVQRFTVALGAHNKRTLSAKIALKNLRA